MTDNLCNIDFDDFTSPFSTLFSMFVYSDEALPLSFDISHHHDLSVATFRLKACYNFFVHKLLHFALRGPLTCT